MMVKRTVWKVIHIPITINLNRIDVAAALNITPPVQQFFDIMVDHLIAADYLPHLDINTMRTQFKSPRSDSEYFVFVKLGEDIKIKLVLDVRFTDHPSPVRPNNTPHTLHTNFMYNRRIPYVARELGADGSTAQAEFYDIYFDNTNGLEINIDGVSTYTVQDAVNEIDRRISQLP